MKTRIVSIDINPWIGRLWVSRLPNPLPRNYFGGHHVRMYRHTIRRVNAIWNATTGWHWSQDNNGYHLRRA